MCEKCSCIAADLIEARAQSNRIRIDVQHQLTHLLECLGVVLSVDNPTEWVEACQDSVRHIIRDLNKLPKN